MSGLQAHFERILARPPLVFVVLASGGRADIAHNPRASSGRFVASGAHRKAHSGRHPCGSIQPAQKSLASCNATIVHEELPWMFATTRSARHVSVAGTPAHRWNQADWGRDRARDRLQTQIALGCAGSQASFATPTPFEVAFGAPLESEVEVPSSRSGPECQSALVQQKGTVLITPGAAQLGEPSALTTKGFAQRLEAAIAADLERAEADEMVTGATAHAGLASCGTRPGSLERSPAFDLASGNVASDEMVTGVCARAGLASCGTRPGSLESSPAYDLASGNVASDEIESLRLKVHSAVAPLKAARKMKSKTAKKAAAKCELLALDAALVLADAERLEANDLAGLMASHAVRESELEACRAELAMFDSCAGTIAGLASCETRPGSLESSPADQPCSSSADALPSLGGSFADTIAGQASCETRPGSLESSPAYQLNLGSADVPMDPSAVEQSGTVVITRDEQEDLQTLQLQQLLISEALCALNDSQKLLTNCETLRRRHAAEL
jgi:hypothetical protein